MARLLTYEKQDTWVHNLSGVTKLVFFMLWTLTSMLTYDTRVLVVMLIISGVVFGVSHIKWQQVKAVITVIAMFLLLNIVFVYIFAPYQGCVFYEGHTVLFHIAGNYDMTAEQLLYEGNMILKYFVIAPAVFMFLLTTDPSEFAASLNRVGISYNAGYALAIALRYIPDVHRDFINIRNAEESRGIEMSGKASLVERIKRTSTIIFPLLFSSVDRIEVVSNAMELRGYGKNKKRTWYRYRPLTGSDYCVIVGTIIFSIIALVVTFYDGNRFLM